MIGNRLVFKKKSQYYIIHIAGFVHVESCYLNCINDKFKQS